MSMTNQEWFEKQIPFTQELYKVAVEFFEEYYDDYYYKDEIPKDIPYFVRRKMPKCKRLNCERFPVVKYYDSDYNQAYTIVHGFKLPDDKLYCRNPEDYKILGEKIRKHFWKQCDYYGRVLDEDYDDGDFGFYLRDNFEVNWYDGLRDVQWEENGQTYNSVVLFEMPECDIPRAISSYFYPYIIR